MLSSARILSVLACKSLTGFEGKKFTLTPSFYFLVKSKVYFSLLILTIPIHLSISYWVAL